MLAFYITRRICIYLLLILALYDVSQADVQKRVPPGVDNAGFSFSACISQNKVRYHKVAGQPRLAYKKADRKDAAV